MMVCVLEREKVFKFLATAKCACFNLMFEKCLLLLDMILEMWIILLARLFVVTHSFHNACPYVYSTCT